MTAPSWVTSIRATVVLVLRWPLQRLGWLTPASSDLILKALAGAAETIERLSQRVDDYDTAWAAIGAKHDTRPDPAAGLIERVDDLTRRVAELEQMRKAFTVAFAAAGVEMPQ